MKRFFTVSSLICLLAILLFAGDPSGKWKGSFDLNGSAVPLTMNLTASGAKVTGTIDGLAKDGTEIKDGALDGESISFYVMTEYQGNTYKVIYKGKISGDQISFTMATDDGSWSTDLTMKRSS